MLWYKAWLETRLGVLFLCTLYLFVWGVVFAASGGAPQKEPSPRELAVTLDVLAFSWIAAAISLAGTGIKTPASGLQNNKGLHGSTHYTLSLPVSRRRLLAVRAVVGLAETAAVIVVFTLVAWWLFPEGIARSTAGDRLAHLAVTLVCASTFHFLSVLLATFLDDALRLPGAMTSLGVLIALDATGVLPPYLNVFRPMGSGSPLETHSVPWLTLAAALTISAALFFAALKVVEAQEY